MSYTKDDRRIMFKKCNGRCAYCGCDLDLDGFHIDHIIPRGKGSNSWNNLLPACASCNSCKSDLSLEEFRGRIYDRVSRLNYYSSEYKTAKRFGLIVEVQKEVKFYFESLPIYVETIL